MRRVKILKVIVKKVKITSEDEFGGIYEFLIHGILNSGRKIKIITSSKFDPRTYLNQAVNLLISAYNLHEIQIEQELGVEFTEERLIGKYIGKFTDSTNWDLGYTSDWYYAMETIDGIILLYRNEFENKIIKRIEELSGKPLEIGDIFSFYAEEYTLEAWKPI